MSTASCAARPCNPASSALELVLPQPAMSFWCCNQLRPSTMELYLCTPELPPAFLGAARSTTTSKGGGTVLSWAVTSCLSGASTTGYLISLSHWLASLLLWQLYVDSCKQKRIGLGACLVAWVAFSCIAWRIQAEHGQAKAMQSCVVMYVW